MTAESLLLWIASIWVLVVAAVIRPSRGMCPAGMHHEGVRRDGAFVCVRAPVGDPGRDGTWGNPDVSVVPPGEIAGHIYCTGGALPIVVDERVVGCQRMLPR